MKYMCATRPVSTYTIILKCMTAVIQNLVLKHSKCTSHIQKLCYDGKNKANKHVHVF